MLLFFLPKTLLFVSLLKSPEAIQASGVSRNVICFSPYSLVRMARRHHVMLDLSGGFLPEGTGDQGEEAALWSIKERK